MQPVTINGWLDFLVDHEPVTHRKYALQFARKQIEKFGKMDIVGIPRGGWVYEQIVDFSPPLTDAVALMDTRTLEHYHSRAPDFESWYAEWHTENLKIRPEDDPDSEFFDPEEYDETPREVVEYMLSQRDWIWQNRFRPAERRLLDALDRRMGPQCDWNDYYDEGEISKSDILKSKKMMAAVDAWYHS